MSDWVRSTRDCTLEGLPGDIVTAIHKHVELYNLGLRPSQVSDCIETTSKKSKAGLFERGNREVVTGVLLAPGWLLWAIRADRPDVTVMSARLADITVQDYAATPFAKMVADSGVEITGCFTAVTERGSSFIGLDDSPAAQHFKQQLMGAVQAARK